MSTAGAYPIDFAVPRTIWTVILQLLYTLLAMLPFYYYLRNIVELPSDAYYLLQYLPIAVGLLLFFIQFSFNDYFWYQEKTFKKRDMFVMGLKSTILVLSMFYTIFFLIFGYWIGNTDAYADGLLADLITRTMIQLTISLGTIVLTLALFKTAQNDFSAARRVSRRFRRR